MKTVYTHTGIIRATYTEDYKALLRKVGKWWETKAGRRFDSDGLEKGHYYHLRWGLKSLWKLDLSTIEKVRTK